MRKKIRRSPWAPHPRWAAPCPSVLAGMGQNCWKTGRDSFLQNLAIGSDGLVTQSAKWEVWISPRFWRPVGKNGSKTCLAS